MVLSPTVFGIFLVMFVLQIVCRRRQYIHKFPQPTSYTTMLVQCKVHHQKTITFWCNVISFPTGVSPNEKSRMFHPLDNASLGRCFHWSTRPRPTRPRERIERTSVTFCSGTHRSRTPYRVIPFLHKEYGAGMSK